MTDSPLGTPLDLKSNPSPSMRAAQRTIRWGILGTGLIARLETTDLQANGFIVQAVGSRSDASAAKFATEHGIPSFHGSYEALVADPDVDAIYIATPHPFHAANALLALRAGKHVLIEKAFTLNATEAREVVDTADRLGLVVMEAMWTRFLPHMVRIRQIIAEGLIGSVHTLIADHNQKLPTDPQHRINNPELGGGALLDLGIYPVSFAFDLFGSPDSITARAAATSTGVDGQTAMLFSYDGGQQAVLQCALDAAGPNRATIIGESGYIDIEGVWYSPTNFTVFDSEHTVIERWVNTVTSRGMQFQSWEFERRIQEVLSSEVAPGERAPQILSAHESVEIMQALDTVRQQIDLVYPSERTAL